MPIMFDKYFRIAWRIVDIQCIGNELAIQMIVNTGEHTACVVLRRLSDMIS